MQKTYISNQLKIDRDIKGKCIICGFDRYCELCHIIPKRLGGGHQESNIITLCPNHHKLFDYFLLNKEELIPIEPYLIKLTIAYKYDLKILKYLYAVLRLTEPPMFYKHKVFRLKQKLSNLL